MSEEKLNQLEGKVNSLKEQKIRTEEQLKSLREQKDKIIAELTVLGVAPKALSMVISELETKIHAQLADISAQIPKDVI